MQFSSPVLLLPRFLRRFLPLQNGGDGPTGPSGEHGPKWGATIGGGLSWESWSGAQMAHNSAMASRPSFDEDLSSRFGLASLERSIYRIVFPAADVQSEQARVMLLKVLVFLLMDFVESAAKRGPTTVEYGADQENEVIHLDGLVCPTESHRLHIFAYKCNAHEDCKGFGELCCRERGWKICRQGVLRRRKEPKHAPFLPGIPRLCPTKEAVIEILPVQNCTRDRDCSPRICCPEGRVSYCRTAVPKINARFYPRIMKSFKAVMAYLQCSSPPPPLLDFFPKPCKNSLDCFPNLCCQERGRKVCRPPKRSLLTHLTSFT